MKFSPDCNPFWHCRISLPHMSQLKFILLS